MRRLFLLVLPLLAASFARGQNPPTVVSATDIPTGQVQFEEAGRDRSGDEPYDVPELYGSRPHELGRGERLPAVVAEYVVRSGTIYQRISVFQNGVAAVHLRGPEGNTIRRLQLADEPIDTLRRLVASVDTNTLKTRELFRDPHEYAELRFGRDGRVDTFPFGSHQVLPQSIETVRVLLGDLLAALVADRQITNPVTEYRAALGDRLVTDDGRTYKVTRLIEDGAVIELEMTNKPLRIVVPAELLYKMFVDVRPAESRSRE